MRSASVRTLLAALVAVAAGCTDQPFTVDVSLRVVSVSPSGGAEGISRRQPVRVTFSEDLDPTTVNASSVVLEKTDGTPVTGEVTYSNEAGTYVATLTPAAPFDYSTPYRVTLATALKRKRDASPLSVKVTSEFKTEDPPPLALLATTPSDGSVNFPRDGRIGLVFSEPLKCSSLGTGVTITEEFDSHPHTAAPAKVVNGTWECKEPTGADALEGGVNCPGTDATLCTVTFKPDDPSFRFTWSSTVRVALAGGRDNTNAVRSFRSTPDGGYLTTGITFDFRIVDPPALLLTSVNPGPVAADQLAVAPATLLRDQSIVVKFSEPVDCRTVNDQTVTLTEDPDPTDATPATAVPITIAECTGKPDGTTTDTLTLSRASGLYPWSAVIEVSVFGGPFGEGTPGAWPSDAVESAIATRFGGQLAANQKMTLIVEDPPPLLVLHTLPGAGSVNARLDSKIDVVFNAPVKLATIAGQPSTSFALTGLNAFDRATRVRAGLPAANLPRCHVTCPDADNDGVSDLIDANDTSLGSKCTCTPEVNGAPFGFDLSSLVSGNISTAVESALTTWRSGALRAPYPFTFRTIDPTPLLVATTSPGDHDTAVTPKLYCDSNGTCAAAPVAGATIVRSGLTVRFDREFDCTSAIGTTAAGPNTVLVEDLSVLDAAGKPTVLTGAVQCLDSSGANSPLAANTLLWIPDTELPWGDKVRLTVKRADIAADAAAVTSNTGVRSRDWTDFADNSSGTLVADLVVRFEVARRPLEIVDSFPRNGELDAPPNTPVSVTFNQAVACDATHQELITGLTVTGDTTSGASALPTVGTFNCATDYDPATFTATYHITDPNAASKGTNLVLGGVYTLTFKGGGHPNGPHDPAQASFLMADYSLRFKVTSSGLRGYEIPADGATGVTPDQKICEVFGRQLTNASPDPMIEVTFVDCTGRKVTVKGDAQFWNFPDPQNAPLTGAPTANPKTTAGNAVCFVPRLASYDCFDVPQLLPYGHEITVAISGAVSGGESQGSPFSWTFRTMDPPQIRKAVYTNEVLAGALAEPLRPAIGTPADVPVNSQYVFDFALPVNPSTVTGSNIALVNRGTGKTYPICPASITADCLAATFSNGLNGDATKPMTMTLTPTGATGPILLAYASAHTLTLKGGANGLGFFNATGATNSTTGLTSYLQASVAYPFVTSPSTRVTINPGSDLNNTTLNASLAWTIYPDEEIPVVFDRPIRFSSASTLNIFGRDPVQTPTLMSGIVALNANDSYSAVLITSPTFTKSTNNMAVVVTTGVQDYRGNPLPKGSSADSTDVNAALKNFFNCGNTPSLSSQSPTIIGCANVSPNNSGTCTGVVVSGDQQIAITFGASSGQNDRFLTSSFNADSLSLVTNGGGAGCTAAGTRLPLTTTYRVATAVSAGDSVLIGSPTPFKAGCSYRLTINQARFANVYNLGAAATPFDVVLTGETTAPTLTSPIQGTDATGAVVSVTGSSSVAGDSALVFTFSENLNPAVAASAVSLQDNNGGTVAGKLTVGPNAAKTCASCVATFVPQRYLATGPGILRHGYVYTVRATNAFTDMAGNKLTEVSATFTVESGKPQVVGAPAVTQNAPLAGQRTLALTFSENLDVATLVADTFNADGTLLAAGTVRLVDANGNAVAGCVSLDPTNARRVLFTTTDDTVAAGSYKLSVEITGPTGRGSLGVTDAAGNSLATRYEQAVTL